jgi:predicted amidohydrolase
VRALLAQLRPEPRNVEANLARVRETLERSEGADLVAFPELFLGGYELSDPEAVSISLDGPEVMELRAAARERETAIVVGAAERTDRGVANSALCINRQGELAGVYRKTHLFGAERDAYLEGRGLATVELAGRRLGIMICFDVEFPEVARTLALRGADLLVTISANPTEFRRDHDVFVPARALENGLPHLYVNRVGDQDGIAFAGSSIAIDPEGGVLADTGSDAEQLLVADVGDAGRRDERTRYLQLVRPELYDAPPEPRTE